MSNFVILASYASGMRLCFLVVLRLCSRFRPLSLLFLGGPKRNKFPFGPPHPPLLSSWSKTEQFRFGPALLFP